jgi:alkaline phosphatase D
MKYLLLILLYTQMNARPLLKAGPTICHTTPTSTVIWYEYKESGNDSIFLIHQNVLIKADSFIRKRYLDYVLVKAYFSQLSPNTKYEISLPFAFKNSNYITTFDNSPYSDFSFLIGSCAMTFKKPVSATYPKNKIKIFDEMAKDTAARFMLWTGDYTYLFKHNLKNGRKFFERYNMQRTSFSKIDHFMSAMPQYAMWDDHDYGLDNSSGDNLLKPIAREVFRDIFVNPEPPKTFKDGIYFKLEYDDALCIMMDGRYERNTDKSNLQMWGNTQMTWLENELKKSKHTFKFIVNGSQILTQTRIGESEALSFYPSEYKRLMDFIQKEKIIGVIFISGDIHSAEILRVKREKCYPLYEYTCSALTSQMTNIFHNAEVIPGYRNEKQNNYGKIRIEGIQHNRKCILENYNYLGEIMFRYTINEKELQGFE